MRWAGLFFFSLNIFTLNVWAASPAAGQTAAELLSRLPLRFEPNRGQIRASEPVAWSARGTKAAYAFTADGALIRTRSWREEIPRDLQ